ncbi:DUF2798 domain-containing protein [Acinetobacter sp. ANC 4805]|uniref:DUF2798 domain-containing protein n=1 Tax=Acinetobacter sp. ANC 4805 TaxID=2923425 RepID=UPI001F4A0C65|nr:DUF2798 domain-containing protein [Acinetobacter sp. ANC 4805]MCH7312290.1 DUF2798 domain-containing protein [Acinetobacter sp. ANC 4805]
MGENGMKQTKKISFTKLPARYAAWVMPLLLSGLMSATLSLMNLLMNVGLIDGFAAKWLSTWFFSWLIAYPVVLMFLPIVRRLTSLIVEMPPH